MLLSQYHLYLCSYHMFPSVAYIHPFWHALSAILDVPLCVLSISTNFQLFISVTVALLWVKSEYNVMCSHRYRKQSVVRLQFPAMKMFQNRGSDHVLFGSSMVAVDPDREVYRPMKSVPLHP